MYFLDQEKTVFVLLVKMLWGWLFLKLFLEYLKFLVSYLDLLLVIWLEVLHDLFELGFLNVQLFLVVLSHLTSELVHKSIFELDLVLIMLSYLTDSLNFIIQKHHFLSVFGV